MIKRYSRKKKDLEGCKDKERKIGKNDMQLKNFLTLFILFFLTCNVWAWNDTLTHPEITEKAIDESGIDAYLKNNLNLEDGVNEQFNGLSVTRIMKRGSKLEDEPNCRAANHFHNPHLDWNKAGLTDTLWFVNLYCLLFSDYDPDSVVSNLTWGTGFISAEPNGNEWTFQYDEKIKSINENDWASGREYYHAFLTGTDFQGSAVAPDEQSRKFYMTKVLQSLGQVTHLLQDTSVPAHVRNDFAQGHTMVVPSSQDWPWNWTGNGFEIFMKGKENKSWFIDSSKYVRINKTDLKLSDLWDTNDFTGDTPGVAQNALGLSEFTSTNFLSEYKMFTPGSPYPKETHCQVVLKTPLDLTGPNLDRQYISSTNGHPGTQLDHLAVISSMKYFRDVYFPNISSDPLPLGMDRNCYEEYGSYIIPRAIGYSADLIDYFFRGGMDVSATPFFFDNYGTDPNALYNIIVKVKNVTPGEKMKDGFFTLHYRLDDNGTIIYGDALCGTRQCTAPCISSIASGEIEENQEVVIQFYLPSDSPITTDNFEQVQWSLVFKGTLGNEENAVVGKIFPTTEQQNDNWGTLLFNEEWETLGGYPENNWGHGSCWKSAGLQGHHMLDTSSGCLRNYLVRVADWSPESVSCATVAQPNIPVSPNTWIQFLLHTSQENPIRLTGKDMQCQYMELEFSNGVSLYFYDGDLNYWPNDLPLDPNHLFVPIYSGALAIENIHALLEKNGFTISGPLSLDKIMFSQEMIELPNKPSATQTLNMWINSLRFVNTDPDFSICQ
ncbi:MAG: hypothetical protein JEZ12_13655 [Desulfobacterium sp.]|nr:hypothetical protein [Desulfobacterium sp.]